MNARGDREYECNENKHGGLFHDGSFLREGLRGVRRSTSDSLNHLSLSITFFLEDHAMISNYFLEDHALNSSLFSGRSDVNFQFFQSLEKRELSGSNSSFCDPISLLPCVRCIALQVALHSQNSFFLSVQSTFQFLYPLSQLFQFLAHVRQPADVRIQALVFIQGLNRNAPPNAGPDNLTRQNTRL